MKLRKTAGKWVVDFKLPRPIIQKYGYARFRKRYDKKAIAEKVWGIVHEAIALNDKDGKIGELLRVEKVGGYTIKGFKEKWMEEYVEPKLGKATGERYELSMESFIQFCGDERLASLTKERLHQFVSWRSKHKSRRHKNQETAPLISKSTINKDLIAIRSMFAYATEIEALPVNPLLGFDKLSVPGKAMRLPEDDKFFELVDQFEDLGFQALLVFLEETGLRKSEALQTTWPYLDLKNKVLILEGGATKGGRARYLPLSDLCIEWLNKLTRFPGQPYVFCHHAGKFYGKPWIELNKVFHTGRKKLGMEWVTIHTLRHLRGTRWLQMGADVKTVQQGLDHKDIETTMVYVNYNDRFAAEKLREVQKREKELRGKSSAGGN